MSLNISDALILGVGLSVFIACISILVVILYIAYTELDEILGYLQSSPAVIIKAPFKNGGPWGRLFLLGAIVGVLRTPEIYISDGGASVDDIANFPTTLKAKLINLYKVGGYFTWALFLYSAVLIVDWSSMSGVRLGVVVLTSVAIPVWILLCLRLGKTQMGMIATSFKNSSAINIRLKLNAGGYFEKLIFIVAVSVIVTFSSVFIKRGTIDALDFKSLPRTLKFKLFALFGMMAYVIVSLVALYVSRG